eukprot:CAMPEP_0113857442 /NCGR_PEP_ID=MMETSP0372-20130328/10180_1 /TAXON_ID=340204 /ORGANISM="Lankesteria abbotti" /LENGTH=172 /DNA_ID=CAMNT_0000833327 /DNA_START=52 /DNA_END=570 /DNA_ORIENTATION=+ /assembly_acc=CAM_ASM_000359
MSVKGQFSFYFTEGGVLMDLHLAENNVYLRLIDYRTAKFFISQAMRSVAGERNCFAKFNLGNKKDVTSKQLVKSTKLVKSNLTVHLLPYEIDVRSYELIMSASEVFFDSIGSSDDIRKSALEKLFDSGILKYGKLKRRGSSGLKRRGSSGDINTSASAGFTNTIGLKRRAVV